jgi:hypothetical protein
MRELDFKIAPAKSAFMVRLKQERASRTAAGLTNYDLLSDDDVDAEGFQTAALADPSLDLDEGDLFGVLLRYSESSEKK